MAYRSPAKVVKLRPGQTFNASGGSLRSAVAEAARDPGVVDITDPAERAAAIVSVVRGTHPGAWQTRSVQNAAAKAVGVETPTALEAEVRTDSATADAAKARRATARRRTVGRKARRLGRVATAPRFAPTASARGIVAQVVGLLLLFWVLRTPGVIARITGGLAAGFQWLVSVRGVPANPAAPAPLQGFTTPPPSSGDPAAAAGAQGDAVARWGGLVQKYFPPAQVDKALRVLWCESRGNPNAVNASSGASGLFQHMPQWWAARSAAAGFPGRSVFDPEANVGTAGWLYRRDGWGAWSCGDA
jgi:hypothetical protein